MLFVLCSLVLSGVTACTNCNKDFCRTTLPDDAERQVKTIADLHGYPVPGPAVEAPTPAPVAAPAPPAPPALEKALQQRDMTPPPPPPSHKKHKLDVREAS